jgi:hypothetical protein
MANNNSESFEEELESAMRKELVQPSQQSKKMASNHKV